MLKLRRAESVNIDMRIFFADVPEQSRYQSNDKLRMMPALHQNLNTAHRGKFVEFLIELLAAEDIMVSSFSVR